MMIKTLAPALLLALATVSAQAAAPSEQLKGTGGCTAVAAKIGDAAVQFCMFPGSFGDDSYEIKADGKTAIKADMEASMNGATGTIGGQSATLKCTSQTHTVDGEESEVGRTCEVSTADGVALQVSIDLSLVNPVQ